MQRLRSGLRTGLTPARLRLFLSLLFLALAVPTAILVAQTQRQLKLESFHQYRGLAEELAQRIDAELQRLLDVEEQRGYADYRFLVVSGDPLQSSLLQRSPLATYPVESGIPGLQGYFQVGAQGEFSTPLLPDNPKDLGRAGVGAPERALREALRDTLLAVLSQNQLVPQMRERDTLAARTDAERERRALGASAVSSYAPGSGAASRDAEAPAQRAFDELNAAPAEERAPQPKGKASPRLLRKEQAAEVQDAAGESVAPPGRRAAAAGSPSARVRIFESELAPFEFALLDSGHFVLFRKVWRDGQRTIQGALIDQAAFLDALIGQAFRDTSLSQMSELVVAYQGDVLRLVGGATRGDYPDSAEALQGSVLHQARLSAPLGDVQLIWTIQRLPAGPGERIVLWTSAVLATVLLLGFLALHSLGLHQIRLARQQQDFVSAVSHELKTPLTSIRMYGEMLREGWVSEDKKREYYCFIHDESERLSRLIANVLQLARMERKDFNLQPRPVRVQSLMDLLRSKVHGPAERAGFELACTVAPDCAQRELDVDSDAFAQILLNLVDNALKFSTAAATKRLEISARMRGAGAVAWSVRDYGPGVPRAQMKKIFELFYRPDAELSRETVGTGIGLALARQLARAMGGEIDVCNREPGAEFELRLPLRS